MVTVQEFVKTTLSSGYINKSLYGILLSDGWIDSNYPRFGFGNKNPNYCDMIYHILSSITHCKVNTRTYKDKRFENTYTYRVDGNHKVIFQKLRKELYEDRKVLTPKVCKKIDAVALAHIWMGDGLLQKTKNRKKDKIQFKGIFCLESFPFDELYLLQQHLLNLRIQTSFYKVRWGYGIRLMCGGKNLQRLISLIYPYVLTDYEYKLNLYYKTPDKYCDMTLANTDHFIKSYSTISEIEDIVRAPKKFVRQLGTTTTR